MFETPFDYIPVILSLLVIIWVLHLRKIVPPKYADVVTRKSGFEIYSADKTVTMRNGTRLTAPNTVYYQFPAWVPVVGTLVKRMPLTIIEIPVTNYKTFAKGNSRFVVDVSVYCQITDVLQAAQKFPGNTIDDFKAGIREIVVSAIRRATTSYVVEDVIAKRQEIATDIFNDIKDDITKWGVELTNVAIVDIRDPIKEDAAGKPICDAKGEPILETTVIRDISNKSEAGINAISREEVANRRRQAEMAEATNRQAAETRKIEADEAIAKRQQEQEQVVALARKEAVLKQLEVERTEMETRADIEANVAMKRADGERRATIQTAEGNREKAVLEGQGEAEQKKLVGTAEADVIRAQKVAEAEGLSRIADAQKKQQENAKEIRLIERDEAVYKAYAEALAQADVRFIGSGDPKGFLDLFTPGGGLKIGGSLGGVVAGLQNTSPETAAKVADLLEEPWLKDLLTNPGVGDLLKGLAGEGKPPAEGEDSSQPPK